MRAGELRHKITIEQVAETQDDGGGIVETWSTYLTTMAAVKPLVGREYFASQQVGSDVTHKIIMRYRAGITTKMRVKFGDRYFDITSVLNIEERKRMIEILATETI